MWNNVELLTSDDTGSGHINGGSRKENVTALYQVDLLGRISSEKAFVKRDNDEYQRTYHNFIIEKDGSNEAIENTDLDLAKKLQGQFKCSFISTENYHNLGCLNLVAGEFASETPVIIGGAGSCAFSKWESDSTKKEMSLKNFVDTEIVKGAKSFQLIDNLLFVLDTDNVLSLWDAYTLTPVWNWPSLPIEQFLLTTEADSPSSVTWQGIANLKLVTLTATTKEKMRSLIIFSLPSMEILYSLEVSSVSSLVQTGISTDTIYLLEGIHKNDPKLRRLLHKHRFAEAESFAIQFGLDVELVYKVKSNDILEKLALISLDTSEQTKWQQLVEEAQENLCKIQDDDFVVNFCLKAQWITYETTQEMLSYAKARLLKKEDKTLPAYSDGFMEVLKAHAKLTTFYGAFGPEKFSGSSWIEFLNSEDVLGDIFMQLREGNLVCAQYLWLRHRADFESKFDVKMLENLLNSISTQVSLEKLCSWFKNDVIPFVRRIVPEGQNILAKWLEQASRNLELTDKANWPENGLQLAEVFFTAEKTEKFGFASSWHWISWKDYQNTEEVQQLQTLVIKLQELITLHKKYNCKLSLSEFEKENTTTIVFRMIDRVSAPELIPSVLEKFVRVYMREQNLQEELLLLYIEDLLKRCSSKSATLFDTAWEAKAMAVIRCLSDIDLIFDAVLKIMYKAVVPWSAAVEQLVKQHLEMDHPKVKLLQESYKLMEMKKLLRGYGIREVNLLNKEIMRVVRYILKQDTPSSLEDALKVAQGYRLSDDEIYSLRIIDLIDREQRDDCLLLLRSLPPVEAEKTAERVIIWARLALQEEPDGSEEDKAWRMSVAKTSVDILKILCDIQKVTGNLQKKDDSEEFLKQFKVVASLQENFEVFLPFEDYSNSTLVADLREQYIKAHEDAQAEHKLRGPPGPTLARGTDLSIKSKLHRQALALQVSAQELEAELALRALKHGKVGAALSKCRYLLNYYCNADTGRLLFLVCQKLCHMLANDVPMTAPVGLNLPSEIHDLACQAATLCSTDTLLDALELSKYTLTAVELSRQCQMDDSGILMKAAFGTHKDPYEEWSYSDFFSEDGIVLESQVVLPVIYELISSVVPLAESKRYPLDSISLPYCSTSKGDNLILPIVRSISTLLWNLQESSQWEMALRFVIGSFGACLQHSMSNIMSASLSEKLLGETTMANSKQIVVELKEKSVMFIRGNATTLLHKVFNCRLVDLDLALAYCTLLPQKDVFENLWKLIDKAWQNYNKILLDSDAALQLFIETLLHNTNNQSQGDASLEPTKQQHSRLLAKATEMVPLLASTKDLVVSLTGILYKLDPYDYEMIEVVLKVIEQANEKITSVNINQFSLDTLYVSTAKHVFEKNLKPKLLKLAQAQSALMSKEVDKLTQTIESYLLSIVNPEWAVAIAISLTQEIPEDIHEAAKEIAEVNEINLEKIWDMLLEKWLCPSTVPSEKASEFFELEEDEVLHRVVYLLQSRPIDYSSRMLFVFAISATSTLGMRQLTFAHKTRALQCLFYLADKEMIESLFKKPTEEIKSYLKCITFLASFETLNIPITYELFCNSPKEGMIKGLWKNHSHESMAVRLVAELCLEYKIYDLQLWNGLLQKLLGFNMIPYLRKVLSSISSVHSLWQVPYFSRAWQCVIQIPLLSASCPLRPSQLSDCCESLVAILECPVSDDLDMIGVAKQYVQLELPAFALACLMLMPHSEKRQQQIKNFLDSCDAQIILQQLEEHMSTGQLAGFSHQIRSLILNHVINKKEFGILAKTKYFQLLKWHMINTNNITELVNYLANDLSLDEASALIIEYSKHCGKSVPSDAAPCEILKTFLGGSS
ncbi:kinetochore associated 1 [Cricetulus griseus]